MRLIDADELKKIYEDWLSDCDGLDDEGDRRGIATCIYALDDEPSIDAELVRHGRWILIIESATPYEVEIEEECSLCGANVSRYDTQPPNRFCPNCGAKMDLEVHDENT